MEERIKKVESRVDKIERKLKMSPPSKGKDVKCNRCGWTMKVCSKRKMISCSSCGNKIKNTTLKDDKK